MIRLLNWIYFINKRFNHEPNLADPVNINVPKLARKRVMKKSTIGLLDEKKIIRTNKTIGAAIKENPIAYKAMRTPAIAIDGPRTNIPFKTMTKIILKLKVSFSLLIGVLFIVVWSLVIYLSTSSSDLPKS